MTAVQVLIATTRGPSRIQRITAEDAEVRSVICLDGKAMPLPISGAYENFVRAPTGVVERAFGHPSYRLDVECPIDDGASWQLGVFLAHVLAQSGRLAGKGETGGILVWCSGEVDHDLMVRPVGHVTEKVERSLEVFRKAVAAGIPVLVLLPVGNVGQGAPAGLAEMSRAGAVRVVAVSSMEDACDALGLVLPDGDARDAEPPQPPRWRWSFLLVSTLVLAVLLGFIAWKVLSFGDMPIAEIPSEGLERRDPSPPTIAHLVPGSALASAESVLTLAISELRRPDGTCPEIFAPDRLQVIPLALDRGRATPSMLGGLCGLRLSVTSRAEPAYLWGFAQMIPDKVFLMADLGGLRVANTAPRQHASWDVQIPDGRTRPLRYVFVAVASSAPLTDAAALLPGKVDWSGVRPLADDLKAIADAMVGQGAALVMAAHEVVP